MNSAKNSLSNCVKVYFKILGELFSFCISFAGDFRILLGLEICNNCFPF